MPEPNTIYVSSNGFNWSSFIGAIVGVIGSLIVFKLNDRQNRKRDKISQLRDLKMLINDAICINYSFSDYIFSLLKQNSVGILHSYDSDSSNINEYGYKLVKIINTLKYSYYEVSSKMNKALEGGIDKCEKAYDTYINCLCYNRSAFSQIQYSKLLEKKRIELLKAKIELDETLNYVLLVLNQEEYMVKYPIKYRITRIKHFNENDNNEKPTEINVDTNKKLKSNTHRPPYCDCE
jgi:hypothetical protein